MARTKKDLLPVDARIASLLAMHVEQAGITRRELAAKTGMSLNRLGIILRQEPPPATVGEVGMIAQAVGTTASAIIAQAESNVTQLRPNVGGRPNTDLETVELNTTLLAASTDNTPIDPSRGEAN